MKKKLSIMLVVILMFSFVLPVYASSDEGLSFSTKMYSSSYKVKMHDTYLNVFEDESGLPYVPLRDLLDHGYVLNFIPGDSGTGEYYVSTPKDSKYKKVARNAPLQGKLAGVAYGKVNTLIDSTVYLDGYFVEHIVMNNRVLVPLDSLCIFGYMQYEPKSNTFIVYDTKDGEGTMMSKLSLVDEGKGPFRAAMQLPQGEYGTVYTLLNLQNNTNKKIVSLEVNYQLYDTEHQPMFIEVADVMNPCYVLPGEKFWVASEIQNISSYDVGDVVVSYIIVEYEDGNTDIQHYGCREYVERAK